MTHVLVTGGVRSGKSSYAEALLDADAAVTYLTPGYPADAVDAEWAARVAAHQLRRPPAWRTIESLDLAETLRAVDGPVLIDCLGTWLTRLFDAWDAWEDDSVHHLGRLDGELSTLAAAVREHTSDVIVVTNEVGWGVVSAYKSGRVFADQLGRVNQAIGAACDQVVLMVAGRALMLPDGSGGPS